MAAGAFLLRLPSLKYLMVGAFCAGLNLVIQNTAVLVFGAHYALASLLSFLILVPLSFYIHRKVTFRTEGSIAPRRFVFYTIQWTLLLGANIALLALLVDVLHLHVSLAIVMVALATHLASFLYTRTYVFKSEAPGP